MTAVLVLLGFVTAELATAFVAVPLGAAVHAAVVAVALGLYVAADDREPLLAVVALLSAGRLVAMALPVGTESLAIRAAVVGGPLVLGGLLLARHMGDAGSAPARRSRAGAVAAAAVIGVPLGAMAASAEHLRPPVFVHPVAGYVVTALCLALFSAAAEELGFRRLLLPAAERSLGRAGAWLASTGLFAATFLASRSVAMTLVAVVAGLAFTWAYQRTRDAVVPMVGHAVATIGAFLVWPAVLR